MDTGRMGGMAHQMISQEMRTCIAECENCKQVCAVTIQHCLQMGGEHAQPAHIRLMMDCVEICQTSASFMLRGSNYHTRTCGVCAEVCDACAADCERFTDDAMMQECARACRSCAQSCHEMASMAH